MRVAQATETRQRDTEQKYGWFLRVESTAHAV
jgi:hypothetical protein